MMIQRLNQRLLRIAVACVIGYGGVFATGQDAEGQTRRPVSAASKQAVDARLLSQAVQNIERHRKTDVTLRFQTADGQPVRGAKVAVRQVGHEFLVGCTIFDLVWQDQTYQPELYKQRFQDLFNFAVFPFYWRRYEPQPGVTMQDKILNVVRWCQAKGITTKGHPLVWTNRSGVPLWLQERTAEEREKRLLNRVKREVGTFAGSIDIWDVVNEAVNTRTWDHAVTGGDYIREPIDRIADSVDKAFRAAHQANPKAHLILNEYNTIAKPEVRERFYQLAKELKRRGTPVSGLGIQAHEPRQEWYPPADVWATFDRLASLGYALHVTEFIPQSGGKDITGGWREGKWTEQTQADFAEQFFRLSFGHPAVVSINWWGLSDRHIWLPGGGLITADYATKPVYERLKHLIHDEWTTRLEDTTDANGSVAFRGFYGRYSIRVTGGGRGSHAFDAKLTKGGETEWQFTVRE